MGFFISCEYLSNMKKFILSESEKKYILNLYRTKNLIKEESDAVETNTPYGLKVDFVTGKATNFKEVFGFDLEYERMSIGRAIDINFAKTNFITNLFIYDTDVLPKEKAKEFILKASNGTLNSSDITNKTLPKFDELFLAIKENKLTNFIKKYVILYVANDGTNMGFLLIPNNDAKSKISYIDVSSNNTSIKVELVTGKTFESTNYTINTDSSGNKVLFFNELESNLQGGPAYTKTMKKANMDDTLSDTYNNLTYVKMGDKGKIVQSIQLYLLNLGYDKYNITKDKAACKAYMYDCDGVFGNGTRKAVIKYQKDNGLKPDGVVGPSTGKSLENNYSNMSLKKNR